MNRGVAVKIKYFDENGGWSERKSGAAASAVFAAKNIAVANVDMNHLEPADVDRLQDLVATSAPTAVVMQNVSPATLTRIKTYPQIRKAYAVMETSRCEQQEDSTMALLRLGLQCEPTEVPKTDGKQAFRALVQVNIRVPNGPSLSITVLHMEPGASRRLTFAMALLRAHPNVDIAVLLSNVTDGMNPNGDSYRELQSNRATAGFVDVMEEGMERTSNWTTPWTVWLKSTKYSIVASTAELFVGQEPRFLSTTLGVRGQANPNSTIAIPMPRSAKSGRTRSPSATPLSGTPQQPLADPAILSAETVRTTTPSPQPNSSATEIIQRLMRQQQATQQRWKAAHSFVLKGTDTKLSSTEALYDVSPHFANPNDATDALNSKALNWPAEFCVVQNTVLCADSVAHCDRQAFRRYVRDNKTNMNLTSQIMAATTAFAAAAAAAPIATPVAAAGAGSAGVAAAAGPAAAHTGDKQWTKSTARTEMEDFINFQRQLKESVRREWSESCCVIVYQITPREMKFNVTQAIGLGKDNLKKAIHYLNHAKTTSKETNPLHDYPYDYALLFSVERQGYWLIAATHVPCDIVACRMVV
ncbi:hypothetical protein ABB37_08691 [Leptomonas pyrrhocoris]|uniref:Uncharacterized protein n=1 Tax=Leptomonas pyrrhocoris TaxID=157538 RepID=A0A0M9FT04_LEPPY|nr:hypothetical protein ABB37_08691 [Leptomonas pyrrhocoris]KPA75423.1 hypothetical protein ABB37_08691 [Leptomonas pyrrhocoris]|eukprot:XP_015653862.1 hypothetical protein ABB37_08691 [Leptomonas pyrrhocoris]